MAEPGGLPSMGSHRVGHDWSDLAAAALHVIMVVLNFSAQLFTSEQVFLCILKTCWTHSSENFFWYKFFKMFCVFYNQVIVKQGQFFLFFSTWFNLPANTLNESGKVPNHRGRFLSFTVEISVSHWDTHGQKSLAGYSPWSLKESDTTEWLTLTLFHCWCWETKKKRNSWDGHVDTAIFKMDNQQGPTV